MPLKIPSSLLTHDVLGEVSLRLAYHPYRIEASPDSAVVWDAIMEATSGGIPVLTEKGWYDDPVFVAWKALRWHNIWERCVLVLLNNLGLLACP